MEVNVLEEIDIVKAEAVEIKEEMKEDAKDTIHSKQEENRIWFEYQKNNLSVVQPEISFKLTCKVCKFDASSPKEFREHSNLEHASKKGRSQEVRF